MPLAVRAQEQAHEIETSAGRYLQRPGGRDLPSALPVHLLAEYVLSLAGEASWMP